MIDAVTGFTNASGSVRLDGRELMNLPAANRARAGVCRSFQSLELFEDVTVFDNLRAASDPRDKLSYVRDLVYPMSPPLPTSMVAAIREFGLEDDLNRLVQDLPYARRRLLAIARAIAAQPSVLLLDEPAAGLGDVETGELVHLVRRLADDWGIAVLLIEHDMNFVMSVCDRIVVLDFGRQIAEGTPEEIRNNPAVVAAYLGEHEDDGAVEREPTSGRRQMADSSGDRRRQRRPEAAIEAARDLRRLRAATGDPRHRSPRPPRRGGHPARVQRRREDDDVAGVGRRAPAARAARWPSTGP